MEFAESEIHVIFEENRLRLRFQIVGGTLEEMWERFFDIAGKINRPHFYASLGVEGATEEHPVYPVHKGGKWFIPAEVTTLSSDFQLAVYAHC